MTVPTEARVTREDLQAHMHLVRIIVSRFVRRLPPNVQSEDLVAAGTDGLFRALQASGHLRAASPDMFDAYAKIRIRGAILDELRRNDWSPRRRKPVSTDAAAPPVHVVGFDDLAPEVLDPLLAGDSRSPEAELNDKTTAGALRVCIDGLPAREREIIQLRYFDGVPSKEIASMLRVSEARVSQLHARAVATMRARFVHSNADMALAA